MALEDDLFRALKERAARDGVTMGALVNRLLRKGMREPEHGRAFRFHLTTVEGRLREGVNIDDTGALLDLMDGGR